MVDKHTDKEPDEKEELEKELPDENMHLFVYGNLTIRDVETGTILVNKSF